MCTVQQTDNAPPSPLPISLLRFIFPILPIAHIYAGFALGYVYNKKKVNKKEQEQEQQEEVYADSSKQRSKAQNNNNNNKKQKKKKKKKLGSRIDTRKMVLAVFVLVAVSNVAMGAYFSFVHQRGVIDVMTYLRQQQQQQQQQQEINNKQQQEEVQDEEQDEVNINEGMAKQSLLYIFYIHPFDFCVAVIHPFDFGMVTN